MNKEQAVEKIKADVMNILKEHSTFMDGQIKGLIIHGAIEKIAEYIAGRTVGSDENEKLKKENEELNRENELLEETIELGETRNSHLIETNITLRNQLQQGVERERELEEAIETYCKHMEKHGKANGNNFYVLFKQLLNK